MRTNPAAQDTAIDPNLFYDARFLAKRYGVDLSTVWRWCDEGKFPKQTKLTNGCSRWLGKSILDHERAKGGDAA